ncbi:MAG: membrane protein insertion efficiency factor YidD [Candidatus Absconditabacterales bacterium]|nr:membrane protein insertion efficiency factor YidD [Candidatus Absconditabacterales bacterium]
MTYIAKFGHYIDNTLKAIARFLITFYQKTLSPDTGLLSLFFRHRICAHHPSCSNYGLLCFKDFTFLKAIIMTIERITRCGPANTISYDPHRFRVAFASSAPIGIPFLDAIANHERCELICVVTMPDAPQGRGMTIKPNIIASHATQYIDSKHILKPSKIDPDKSSEGSNFAQTLKNYEIDYLIVIAYGKIIPQSILDIPKILSINVHGSILPHYRGASPIQQALLDGCNETGITIMKMEAGLDTGPIMKIKNIKLTPVTTALDLINEMTKHGPQLLIDAMIEYPRGHCPLKEQDHTQATYTTKISKKEGIINPFADTIQTIIRKHNAYYLWPKIRFEYKNIWHTIETIVFDDELRNNKNHPGWHNILIDQKCRSLSSYIKHIIIKPENKKGMARTEWTQWIERQ